MLELRELLARRERDPADGHLAVVGDETRRSAAIDELLQLRTVGLGARHAFGRHVLTAAAIEHAPAASRNGAALRLEHRFDIGPAIRRRGSDRELHGAGHFYGCARPREVWLSLTHDRRRSRRPVR